DQCHAFVAPAALTANSHDELLRSAALDFAVAGKNRKERLGEIHAHDVDAGSGKLDVILDAVSEDEKRGEQQRRRNAKRHVETLVHEGGWPNVASVRNRV